jgi:hypothetical protein
MAGDAVGMVGATRDDMGCCCWGYSRWQGLLLLMGLLVMAGAATADGLLVVTGATRDDRGCCY